MPEISRRHFRVYRQQRGGVPGTPCAPEATELATTLGELPWVSPGSPGRRHDTDRRASGFGRPSAASWAERLTLARPSWERKAGLRPGVRREFGEALGAGAVRSGCPWGRWRSLGRRVVGADGTRPSCTPPSRGKGEAAAAGVIWSLRGQVGRTDAWILAECLPGACCGWLGYVGLTEELVFFHFSAYIPERVKSQPQLL